MPKISIVVPVYGVEAYIERCVRSLFEQTLDDLEYIFVNDCSRDNSVKILKELITEYQINNVRIVNHSENMGLPQARKSGISIATGDYIINVDSDDWVDKDYCKLLYNKAVEDNSDMVVCGYWSVDEAQEQREPWCDLSIYSKSEMAMKYSVAMLLTPNIWIKLVKRDILQRPDFVFPRSFLAEDWVMTVQCVFYADKISYVPKNLYYYDIGNNTQSKKTDKESSIINSIQEKNNVRLIEKWLWNRRVWHKYFPEIVRRKYRTKMYLQPYLFDKKVYLRWVSLFWEINVPILFNKYISKVEKRKFLKKLLRIV